MRKSNFERELHDKLTGYSQSPPDGMWARIEKSLQQQGATPQIQPVRPEISIRRPKKSRLRWQYAAASVAAVIMLVVGIKNINEDQIPQPDNIFAGAINESVEMPASQLIQPNESEPDVINNSSTLLAAVVESPRVAEQRTQVVSENPAVDVLPDAIVSENVNNDSAETDSTDKKHQQAAETQTGTGKEQNTSDMKMWGESAERARAYAEYSRRSRRTPPVTASLFAANSSISGNTQDVKTGIIAASSSFTVEEKNIPTDQLPQTDIIRTYAVTKKLKHDVPITFGASVTIGLVPNLSLETGVNYTYMKSESEASGQFDYRVKQKLHYVGIPVGLKFDFLNTRYIGLYVSAGGAVEKCVSARQTITSYSQNDIQSRPESEKLRVKGVQTSAGARVGVEIKANDTFGIYAEPGIGYYFKNSHQPENYRTENPLSFSFRAGLRLKL